MHAVFISVRCGAACAADLQRYAGRFCGLYEMTALAAEQKRYLPEIWQEWCVRAENVCPEGMLAQELRRRFPAGNPNAAKKGLRQYQWLLGRIRKAKILRDPRSVLRVNTTEKGRYSALDGTPLREGSLRRIQSHCWTQNGLVIEPGIVGQEENA